MSEKKRRVGDRETTVYEWQWQECEYCSRPAKYRVTFLLPDCRVNPASSAYHHDDCSWCADEFLYTCKAHKKQAKLEGYELCSIFPLAHFRRMGWYKVKVSKEQDGLQKRKKRLRSRAIASRRHEMWKFLLSCLIVLAAAIGGTVLGWALEIVLSIIIGG